MTHPLRAALLAGAVLALPVAAAAQAPVVASRAAVPPLAYNERALANGLRVFTVHDAKTSNVTVQVWYGVGGKDDPQGRSGFAHLFEHMMFKATRDMPAEFMDRLTEDVGGENNAFTADDMTVYHEVIPANHLERLLWAEAERMGSLVVDDANFRSEREVVKEELRQRVLADPYGRFQNLIPGASFTVHPYKRPVIGSIADLDAASLADVQRFHATYYRPDNAALIVIGNFDEAQAQAWADRYFALLARPAAATPRVTAVEPARTAARTETGYGPNVPLPGVALTWLIPAAPDPDAPPLAVADALLSAGKSSRLYRDLVYRDQVAVQINSNADLRQQPGLFQAYAILSGGHAVAEGEAALRAEVKRLREAPAEASELARAKNQLVSQQLQARETIDGRAFDLGRAIVVENDPERVNRDIALLQAVTAADVQRVAARYLTDAASVAVRYLDEKRRPAGATPAAAAAPSPPVSTATGPKTAQQPVSPQVRVAPPAPGAPVKATPPLIAERTLANGLQVVLARTGDLPLVSASLVVRSGATSDPAGLAGLASITAGLLTQGTAARTAPQIAEEIEALGGAITPSSTFDHSDIDMTVLADQLPSALPILADVVRRPAFAPGELQRLRAQRLDALSVSLQDPGELAGLASWPTVWGGTPYGHPPGGAPASLARIRREDVAGLYARLYRPDNAVLVITGGIAPEAAFALAEQAFGDWARPSAPLPRLAAAAAPGQARMIVVDLPGAGQAAVSLVAPSIRRADPRYYPARVANAVLGGGYSARLNAEVRVKRGLSYGAGSSLSALRDAGLFTARAQTKNESAGEVAQVMLELARGLDAAPIAPAELDARKAALTGAYGRETERSAGLTDQIAAFALYGLPLSEVGAFSDRVQAVTADQARAAAPAAVDPAHASVIVVGDARILLPDLQKRFKSVEVIPAAALDLEGGRMGAK